MDNFCAFILSHGRPDNVKTYRTLRKHGYTGKIYIIIDNEDSTADQYYINYKDEVIMFDKIKIAKTFDTYDNFNKRNSIVFARNACWDIAEKLGIEYFIQLDDDYTDFCYKLDSEFNYTHVAIKNLDRIFEILLNYYKSIPTKSIALAQNGDFLGGSNGNAAKNPRFRKCMNSFICSGNRKFVFKGTLNEDVNAYTNLAKKGDLFLTIPNIALQQVNTQGNKGGMSDIYHSSGTYVKSFYSVISHPSGVKVTKMNSRHPRLHHTVSWNHTAPKIISDAYKKYFTFKK